jgi:hypothetical protein
MSTSHQTQLPGPVTAAGTYQMAPMRPPQPVNTSASLSTVGTSSTNTVVEPRIAWKHEGYPQFSKLMASDDDLFVFRRFATVNARVILWMQHQIAEMEVRLEKMDERMRQEEKGRNDSFAWDTQWYMDRNNLMRELSATVLHYSKIASVNRGSRAYNV